MLPDHHSSELFYLADNPVGLRVYEAAKAPIGERGGTILAIIISSSSLFYRVVKFRVQHLACKRRWAGPTPIIWEAQIS
jgi:hypothetical protein